MQYVCVCVKFGELPINTLQVLRDQGSCLSKILNMRCSSLILMYQYVWISLVSGDITTYPILYYIDSKWNHLFQDLSD